MPSASEVENGVWRPIPVAARYLRRNAARTMGGSVVRGLVELITNARDSAFRLLSNGAICQAEVLARPIEVEYVLTGTGKQLVVRDRFEGMTAEAMRSRLLRYGAPASGYEGAQFIRGINARGAKDVSALGHVTFESLHGDTFSECEIYGGRVRGPESRPCTATDRERLRVPQGNGTVVTLVPDPGVSVSTFDTIAKDLEHHVEIRYRQAGQPHVPIRLREIRDRRPRNEREIIGFSPQGELLLEEEIPLHEFSRYGAATGRLQIFRSAEALAPLSSRSTMARLWKSEAGILVTDGRTAHDLTFFFSRGADEAAARYLFGELYVPQISELLQEYEEIESRREADESVEFPALNPSQVTDPDRLGLNREHPFVQVLEERTRPLVEEVLRRVEEELAPSAQERVGHDLRQALDRLGEKLAERLDVTLTGPRPGASVRWGLSAVPAGLRVEIGTTKDVTVYYRVEPAGAPDSVQCEATAEGDAIEVSAGVLTLSPVDNQPGVFRGSLDVRGLLLTDLATVRLTAEDKEATVRVSVREPVSGPIQLDRDLQFSQRRYSSLPERRKKIEVLADPSLADRDVAIALTHESIGLSARIVRLAFDEARGIAVGSLHVESRRPATDQITATCGELSDQAAIVFQDFAARPKIDFKFTDIESFLGRRFRWDPQDSNRVLIAGGHPTVARVLGPRQAGQGEQSWPGQSSPQTRAILAELIADAFVFRRLQEEAHTLGTEVDPVDYELLRYQLFEEVYLICHEALTPPYEG